MQEADEPQSMPTVLLIERCLLCQECASTPLDCLVPPGGGDIPEAFPFTSAPVLNFQQRFGRVLNKRMAAKRYEKLKAQGSK